MAFVNDNHLRHFIIPLLTIAIASCNTATTIDSQAEKSKDSVDCKHFIDSLSNTDAVLFDKALRMENDTIDKSISIFRQIVDRHVDTTIDAWKHQNFYATQAKSRLHYFQALKFLYFIKNPETSERTDVTTYHKKFKISNIDSFLTYISKKGLEIYDANETDHENTSCTIEELRKQLTDRRGHAFTTITQLSFIYSIPFPQYSQTAFVESNDPDTYSGIYIRVATNYRLTFIPDRTTGEYKLRKIESYHIDDL